MRSSQFFSPFFDNFFEGNEVDLRSGFLKRVWILKTGWLKHCKSSNIVDVTLGERTLLVSLDIFYAGNFVPVFNRFSLF